MPAALSLINGNIATTLSGNGGSITSGATTFNVASGTGFPTAPFAVVIGSEIVFVTSTGAGTNWTATRGADGSTAAAHTDGDAVTWELTKGVLLSLADAYHKSGTLASRPAAGNNGYIYFATDTRQTFIDNGSAWVDVSGLGLAQWLGTALTYRNTMNFQGVGVHALDNSGSTRTDVNILNGRTMSFMTDDFNGRNSSSGAVGDIGWYYGNGSYAMLAATSGRPGLAQRATGTTSGTKAYDTLRGTTPHTHMWSGDLWKAEAILKLDQNDTVTEFHLGISDDPTANPPNNGIWFQKSFTDTTWFGNCRSASVDSLTASLGTIDTGYHYFMVRRIDASTIGFTIDNNAEVTKTTGIPTNAAMAVYRAIRNNAAVTKSYTIDYYSFQVTGLAR